jgi:hypothetical protein
LLFLAEQTYGGTQDARATESQRIWFFTDGYHCDVPTLKVTRRDTKTLQEAADSVRAESNLQQRFQLRMGRNNFVQPNNVGVPINIVYCYSLQIVRHTQQYFSYILTVSYYWWNREHRYINNY